MKLDDVTFASLVQRSPFILEEKCGKAIFVSHIYASVLGVLTVLQPHIQEMRDLAFLRVFSLNSQCGFPDQLFDVQGSRGTRLNLKVLATTRAALVSYLNWFSYLLLQSLIITITTAFIIETDTTIPDTSISISVHTWRLNIEALS